MERDIETQCRDEQTTFFATLGLAVWDEVKAQGASDLEALAMVYRAGGDHRDEARLLGCDTEIVREEFQAWIRSHTPTADFTRGIGDEYIVRHMQGEWVAFLHGFKKGLGSVTNACGEPGLTEPGKD